jgi:hypothetical protein
LKLKKHDGHAQKSSSEPDPHSVPIDHLSIAKQYFFAIFVTVAVTSFSAHGNSILSLLFGLNLPCCSHTLFHKKIQLTAALTAIAIKEELPLSLPSQQTNDAEMVAQPAFWTY